MYYFGWGGGSLSDSLFHRYKEYSLHSVASTYLAHGRGAPAWEVFCMVQFSILLSPGTDVDKSELGFF